MKLANELQRRRRIVDLQGLKLEDVERVSRSKKPKGRQWDSSSQEKIDLLTQEVGEMVPMKSAFSEVRELLKSPDSGLSVDVIKLVQHILNQNVWVRRVDANYRRPDVLSRARTSIREKFPNFRTNALSREQMGSESEEAIVRKAWNVLVQAADINDPVTCMKELSSFSKRPRHLLKYLIGSYLSLSLNYIRLGFQVFECISKMIIYRFTVGDIRCFFTQEEDELIINYVNTHGFNNQTWKALSLILKRPPKRISGHFRNLEEAKLSGVKGKFTIVEDTIILRHLFIELGLPCDVHGLRSVSFSSFSGLPSVLNRTAPVIYQRYAKFVVRILLSYCYGALHKPWKKDFAKYAIAVKAVAPQDLDIREVHKQWPFLTVGSMKEALLGMCGQNRLRGVPLYKKLQERMDSIDKRSTGGALTKQREDLVKIYTDILKEKQRQMPKD